MAQRLDLRFRNAAGRIPTVCVLDPRTDLTAEQVGAAMDTVIAKNVLQTTGGDLVAKVDARVIDLAEVVQEWTY
ncbi:MAG: DUF2922 domain-containing protein [Firmicutes bacterium]|nr:DUF2922 domain-containing protein [Bacillota bacterium]